MKAEGAQTGVFLDYTNAGAAISSGDVVVLAPDICGVAMTDIGNGETGVVAVEQVWPLASTGVINAWERVGVAATGDPVSTAGAETVGYAIADAVNNTCLVKIQPVVSGT